jgi:hypothetical protein
MFFEFELGREVVVAELVEFSEHSLDFALDTVTISSLGIALVNNEIHLTSIKLTKCELSRVVPVAF